MIFDWIQRACYLSVLGLSYQSYHATQCMSSHLSEMKVHALKSQSYMSQASIDTASSQSLHANSLASQTQANELQQSSSLLQTQAEEDETLANQDLTSAQSYKDTIGTEVTQESVLKSKITSEEAFYKEEVAKANAESSTATSNTVNTESDGIMTSICEIIPFVDIACDVIGGLTAIGFESNTMKYTAQSTIDYTSASMTKAQEDTDMASLESIQTQINDNTSIEQGLEAQANQEEIKAQQEQLQSQQLHQQSIEQETQSEQEENEAQQEMEKAKVEENQAESELDQSILQAMDALKHAVLSCVFSIIVVSFFFIRISAIVLIPFLMAFWSVLATIIITIGTTTSTTIATTTATTSTATLPIRQTYYFLLHCAIYIFTSFTIINSTNNNTTFTLDTTNMYNIQSRGGTILLFAIIASTIQGIILHSIPYLILLIKHEYNQCNDKECNTTTTIMTTLMKRKSIIMTTCFILIKTLFYSVKVILHFIPLFIFETMTLLLLFGTFKIVSFSSSSLSTIASTTGPLKFGILTFMAGIVYVTIFEISRKDDSSNERTSTFCYHDDDDYYSNDEKEDNKNNNNNNNVIDSKDSLINETKSLLFNNGHHTVQRYDCNNKNDNENFKNDNENFKNDIEMSASTESVTEAQHQVRQQDTNIIVATISRSLSLSSSSDNQYQDQNHNNTYYETVPLVVTNVSYQSNQSNNNESYNNTMIQQKLSYSSYMEEIAIKSEHVKVQDDQNNENYHQQHHYHNQHEQEQQQEYSLCNSLQNSIDQYISNLKLPFEILIMTCMIALLKGSIPILLKLIPMVIQKKYDGHLKFFYWELGGVIVGISFTLWLLLKATSNNNKKYWGNLKIWTGDILHCHS